MRKVLLAIGLLGLASCAPTSSNLDDVKQRANETLNRAGFEVIGYEGYEFGTTWIGGEYGGACVWYLLKKKPDNGILYHGCIQRWGSEYHIYNLKAIDAIKPSNR